MPGLSSRNPVSGYGGIGKVYIKYKPKPEKTFPWGFVAFLFCASLTAFSIFWSYNWSRYNMVLPFFRFLIGSFDNINLSRNRVGNSFNISNNVQVEYDSMGFANIRGSSVNDVLFGQGYAHANNRLFQMEILRRKATGTLSQLIGRTALQSDSMIRTLNITGQAHKDLELQSAEELDFLKSYSSGINAYLLDNPILPIEFKVNGISELSPWEPVHSLAILRYQALMIDELWDVKLTETLISAFSAYKADDFFSSSGRNGYQHQHQHGDGDGIGGTDTGHVDASSVVVSTHGTAFAVSGKHTSSGKPLLYASFTAEAETPGFFFLNALSIHNMHISGASFPGVPFVFMGTNNHISWGFSPSDVNTDEIRLETLKMDDDTGSLLFLETRFDDLGYNKWFPVESATEVIEVKGEDSENITVMRTSHGPIVSKVVHRGVTAVLSSWKRDVSVKIAATSSPIKMHFFYDLNLASNWIDFNQAISTSSIFSLNAVYADVHDNIGYTVPGRSILNPLSGYILAAPAYKMVKDSVLTSAVHAMVASKNVTVQTFLEMSECQMSSSPNAQIVEYSKLIQASLKAIVVGKTLGLDESAMTTITSVLNMMDNYVASDFQNSEQHESVTIFVETFRGFAREKFLYNIQHFSPLIRGESNFPMRKSTYAYSTHMSYLDDLLLNKDSSITLMDKHYKSKKMTKSEFIFKVTMDAMEWIGNNWNENPSDWYATDMHSLRIPHINQNYQYFGEISSLGPLRHSVESNVSSICQWTGVEDILSQSSFGCSLSRYDGKSCRLEVLRSIVDMGRNNTYTYHQMNQQSERIRYADLSIDVFSSPSTPTKIITLKSSSIAQKESIPSSNQQSDL